MMNFSMFRNDDGMLGQLANARVVVLRGTVTVSQLFSPNLFDISGWLKTGLENRGFEVNSVRMSPAGWIGYTNNVEIELEVFNNFTAEEARVSAQRAIRDITANYGLNTVFSNVTLSVAFDAFVPPGSPTPSPSPPSAYDRTNNREGRGEDLLGKFGLGLGLSTPFALGAAGLVILLLLKR